jgi:hypothetical protein
MTANASVQEQVHTTTSISAAANATANATSTADAGSKVEETSSNVTVIAQPTAQDPMEDENVSSPTKKAKVIVTNNDTIHIVLNQLKEFNTKIQLDEHSSMSNILQVVGQLLETYQAQKKQIDSLQQENINLKQQHNTIISSAP